MASENAEMILLQAFNDGVSWGMDPIKLRENDESACEVARLFSLQAKETGMSWDVHPTRLRENEEASENAEMVFSISRNAEVMMCLMLLATVCCGYAIALR